MAVLRHRRNLSRYSQRFIDADHPPDVSLDRLATGLSDPKSREMIDEISAGRPTRLRVEDVMTRAVVTATVDTTFKQLERLMAEGDITGLPVIGPTGAIMGWSQKPT